MSQEKEIQELKFYAQPWWKLALFAILLVLSGGTAWLVCLWYPALYTLLTMSPSQPQDAQYVFIEV